MKRRLPKFINKDKICIICEGGEEYDYLSRLKELHVWKENYDITLENAGGNGNIPSRYQDYYQNETYEMIFVFCDTEKKPYEQYYEIKNKINEFHGINDIAQEIVIYGNPCTMQIILMHFDNVRLKTQAKKINAFYIMKYTGVENYKGRASQRKAIMSLITICNYCDMYHRVCEMEHDDKIVGSSNFNMLIDYLSTEDNNWIRKMNKKLSD